MLVHGIDVGCAEKAPVQDHLDLLMPKRVHVAKQLPQGLHIGNVARKLAVIKRQTGLLPEEQAQIELSQMLVILVLAVAHLP